MYELLPLIMAVEHDLKHFRSYMKFLPEETELLLFPGSTNIVYEPLGVVGIFGAWNYPVLTVFKPLIQCITTGNAAIIKPSEVSAATSSVISRFVTRYLDHDCYSVVEGGIDVAVALN
jgi:acyl-CoA reductase-like NAD-dependent aldehyde dehydrogenase